MQHYDPHQTAPRLERLKALTADLRFSRAMLRSFFDTWVVQSGANRTCPGFLFAIASGLDRSQPGAFDPCNQADALALALAGLPYDAQVLSFMAAAIAAGLFDPPDLCKPDQQAAREALMQRALSFAGRDTVAEILPGAQAQGGAQAEAHDNTIIWMDPGHMLPVIIQGRRRLCRILRDTGKGFFEFRGTGFLIGPSAVLTNQHVVDGIKTGEVKKRKLICEFDYSETTGLKEAQGAQRWAADDWHIASSPMGLKEPEHAPDEWWVDDDQRDAFLEQVASDLDYAVIRLDTSPGLQRGWFDLEKLPDAIPAYAIGLHHPGGQDQTISTGPMPFSFMGDVRLFHAAGTARGSSGGLLLNQTAEPIGLHHVGIAYDKNGEKRFVNVAISLQHIARDLEKKAAFADIRKAANIAAPQGCIDGVHPVFGRGDLLGQLQQMYTDPKKRILMVHHDQGGADILSPGKSFTVEIIKSIFRAPEHKHIVFRAGETEADALRFVSETMDSFAADLIKDLPRTPQTTTPAYVQTLVSFFISKLRQRLPNKDVWLMIDDLDRHRVTDASGREVLATLYDQVEQIPGFRVVLIGLPREITLGGVKSENVLHSDINPADLSDFEQHFRRWLDQRTAMGPALNDEAKALLSQIMGSYANGRAPLKLMSDFVVRHMSGAVAQLATAQYGS